MELAMRAPLTFLVVDGHAAVRTALVQRLRRAPGVAVLGAAAGPAEAVQLIRRLAPDVVLYDPKTVEGDARSTLRALLAAGSPVVVWTSSLRAGEAEALLRAGASAALLKDRDLSPLLHVSETLVASQRVP